MAAVLRPFALTGVVGAAVSVDPAVGAPRVRPEGKGLSLEPSWLVSSDPVEPLHV